MLVSLLFLLRLVRSRNSRVVRGSVDILPNRSPHDGNDPGERRSHGILAGCQ